MTKKRSPNYPSISLRDAVKLIKNAYPNIHRHKTDKASLVKMFGYSSLNGASLTTMGALNQYGLLEGRSDSIGISEDGETIAIDHVGSTLRIEALQRCSTNPSVFQDIAEEFGDHLPSDEIIRPFLLRNGFQSTTVDAPIRAYRETMDFVSEEISAYNETTGETLREIGEEIQAQSNEATSEAAPTEQKTNNISMAQGMTQDTFTLDEGQVLLQYPKQLSEDSLELLEMWFNLQLKKAKKKIHEESSVS